MIGTVGVVRKTVNLVPSGIVDSNSTSSTKVKIYKRCFSSLGYTSASAFVGGSLPLLYYQIEE